MKLLLLAVLLAVALSQLASGSGTGSILPQQGSGSMQQQGSGSMQQQDIVLSPNHISDQSFRCFLNCIVKSDMSLAEKEIVKCLFIDRNAQCFDTRVTPLWTPLKICLVPCFRDDQMQQGSGSLQQQGSGTFVAEGTGTMVPPIASQ